MRRPEVAINANCESQDIDFKKGFDGSSAREWCELLKDIFAFGNSGGGVILFGVNNDGSSSDASLAEIGTIDPAALTDKIASYTGLQYSSFQIIVGNRKDRQVVALSLEQIPLLLIPTRPGTYASSDGRQKAAFGAGVVYFRHGAKSEPGNSLDVDAFVERRLRAIRRSWLSGIRKVVRAPAGSTVSVISPEVEKTSPQSLGTSMDSDVRLMAEVSAQSIRITEDPNAPELRLVTPDKTHPYRAMELLRLLNTRLRPYYVKVTVHDLHVLCLLVEPDRLISYRHAPKYGPKQYSVSLIEWVVEEIARDRRFLQLARARYRRVRRQSL